MKTARQIINELCVPKGNTVTILTINEAEKCMYAYASQFANNPSLSLRGEESDEVGYCVCANFVRMKDGYCENCGGVLPLDLKCNNSLRGEEKAEISEKEIKLAGQQHYEGFKKGNLLVNELVGFIDGAKWMQEQLKTVLSKEGEEEKKPESKCIEFAEWISEQEYREVYVKPKDEYLWINSNSNYITTKDLFTLFNQSRK